MIPQFVSYTYIPIISSCTALMLKLSPQPLLSWSSICIHNDTLHASISSSPLPPSPAAITQFRSAKKLLSQELHAASNTTQHTASDAASHTTSDATPHAVATVYASLLSTLSHPHTSLCSFFHLQLWNELLLLLPLAAPLLPPALKQAVLARTLSVCLSLSSFNDRDNLSKTLFLSLLASLPSLTDSPQPFSHLLHTLTAYRALNSNQPLLLHLLFKHASSLDDRRLLLLCLLDNVYASRSKGGWNDLLADIFATTAADQTTLLAALVTAAAIDSTAFLTSQQRLRQKGLLLLLASLPVAAPPPPHSQPLLSPPALHTLLPLLAPAPLLALNPRQLACLLELLVACQAAGRLDASAEAYLQSIDENRNYFCTHAKQRIRLRSFQLLTHRYGAVRDLVFLFSQNTLKNNSTLTEDCSISRQL